MTIGLSIYKQAMRDLVNEPSDRNQARVQIAKAMLTVQKLAGNDSSLDAAYDSLCNALEML